MTYEEIERLANEVIGPILRPHGFEHADVRPYIDHTDEPSLYVGAHFRPDAEVFAGDAFGDALVSLKRALEARGEDRFPYLRLIYPDEQTKARASKARA